MTSPEILAKNGESVGNRAPLLPLSKSAHMHAKTPRPIFTLSSEGEHVHELLRHSTVLNEQHGRTVPGTRAG